MVDGIKNICEKLNMPDECLNHQMSRCSGIVDVNGDGKDDYVIANESFNLNNNGSMRIPLPAIVIFNGTDIGSQSNQAEAMANAEFFNSAGSASFRVNDIVVLEGKEYVLKAFLPIATCSEDGKFVFERSRTSALLVPREISDLGEKLASEWDQSKKKQYVLTTKAKVLEGEELERTKKELVELEGSIKIIEDGLGNVKKLIMEGAISAKLDDLAKAE